MLLKIAAVALALQVVAPDLLLRESSPSAQEVRYRRQADRYFPLEYGGGRRPVPCGHGADIDIRDGLCYPNGAVPRRWQQADRRWVRRGGYYAWKRAQQGEPSSGIQIVSLMQFPPPVALDDDP